MESHSIIADVPALVCSATALFYLWCLFLCNCNKRWSPFSISQGFITHYLLAQFLNWWITLYKYTAFRKPLGLLSTDYKWKRTVQSNSTFAPKTVRVLMRLEINEASWIDSFNNTTVRYICCLRETNGDSLLWTGVVAPWLNAVILRPIKCLGNDQVYWRGSGRRRLRGSDDASYVLIQGLQKYLLPT